MEEVRSDQNLKEISVTKRVKQAPTSKSKLKQKMVKRRGRWLLSEHFRYLYASFTKGNDIKNIQKHVKTRSIQQIRSHSHKYLTKVREIFEKNCLQTKEEYRNNLRLRKRTCETLLQLHSNNYIDIIELEILKYSNLYSQPKSEQGLSSRNLTNYSNNLLYSCNSIDKVSLSSNLIITNYQNSQVKLTEHFTKSNLFKRLKGMLYYLGNSSDLDVIPPKLIGKKENVTLFRETAVKEVDISLTCGQESLNINEIFSFLWDELSKKITERNLYLAYKCLNQINMSAQESTSDTNNHSNYLSSLTGIVQEINLRTSHLVELFSLVLTEKYNLILNSLEFKTEEVQTLFNLIIDMVFSCDY